MAISISSAIPGMPHGKPAGVRCVHLSDASRCLLFGAASRPAVCERFQAAEDVCGASPEEATRLIEELERLTR